MLVIRPVFAALSDSGARYVVVGGVAVVLHGFQRITGDIDIVVDLSPDAARRAIGALVTLGLRSRVPVDPMDFAEPANRARWIAEKGMRVFTMTDPGNPTRSVNLFIENPIEFEELYDRAEVQDLDGTIVRVASIPDLIHMKRLAGRPRDLSDIEALEAIFETRERR